MNVFVQCGLRNRLDYAYLAKENFKFVAYQNLYRHTKWFVAPEVLNVDEPYHVIGVCQNPLIEKLINYYRDNPRIHLFYNTIWHEDVEFVDSDKFFSDFDDANPQPTCPAISLNTLVDKIRNIPGLEYSRIKCIHMNIEGSEREALQGVDWESFTPPDVFRMEIHSDEIGKTCASILESKNYILEEETFGYKNYMMFIKKEAYLTDLRNLPNFMPDLSLRYFND